MDKFPRAFLKLVEAIKACDYCKGVLPLGPNPVLRVGVEKSPILIVGQAPGLRVHLTKLPWNDPSGDKLRQWLSVSREEFYNTKYFTIMPAGFCYPGRDSNGGDLPPRKECKELWWDKILMYTNDFKLILLMGQYAQRIFLRERMKSSLRETVFAWKEYYPPYIPCPHPSFRNNLWLKKNPWFLEEVIPFIRERIRMLIEEVESGIYK